VLRYREVFSQMTGPIHAAHSMYAVPDADHMPKLVNSCFIGT